MAVSVFKSVYHYCFSCQESEIANSRTTKLSSQEQRRLIDQQLDLNVNAGITSRAFLADTELGDGPAEPIASTSKSSTTADEQKKVCAQFTHFTSLINCRHY